MPRPEILFSLALKDKFDPPQGGWAQCSVESAGGVCTITYSGADGGRAATYAIAANSLFKIFPVGLTGIDGTITIRDGRFMARVSTQRNRKDLPWSHARLP